MANVIKTNRSVRLNGLNPLAYIGQNSYTPPDYVIYQRDPTVNDWQDFYVGAIWLNQQDPPTNPAIYNVWMLVSKYKNQALWIQFAGAGGNLRSLSGDVGTNPVFGDVNQNILLHGDGNIITTGVAASHQINLSISGAFANIYQTDFQSPAIPAGNILQVKGGISLDAEQVALTFRKNIHTAANPMNSNLLEVKLNDSISLPNTIANGEAGVYYLGGSTSSDTFIHNFGTHNTFLGNQAGNLTLTTGSATGNTAIGYIALNSVTTAGSNCALGSGALTLLQSGNNNVGIGVDALESITTGGSNTALGTLSGASWTGSESLNIVIGSANAGLVGEIGITRIGTVSGLTSNTNNTFVGFNSGNDTYTLVSAINNTFVGSTTGNAIKTAQHCTFVGATAGAANTTGNFNTYIGDRVAPSATSQAQNTILGCIAGFSLTTGDGDNVIIGYSAMHVGTTASQNVSIGVGSMNSLIDGTYNVALGTSAGIGYTGSESHNVNIGALDTGAFFGVPGEIGVVRIGAASGLIGDNNNLNTFVGYHAGNSTYTLGTASGNTFIGANGGHLVTTGNGNCTLGANAGLVLTTGQNNILIGTSSGGASLVSGITTGSGNCGLGTDTLWTVTTGSRNIAIGNNSGSALATTDSDNICIQSSGVAGNNNIMRIGTGTGSGTGNLAKSFISGIAGVTTDVNDAVNVLISASTGQLGTMSSSQRYKENIRDMANASDGIYKLRPVVFNYKKHSSESKSVGLIAEEVELVMPNLVVYTEDGLPETIKYHDLVPMLLNEIQKLAKRVNELEKSLN